MTLIKGKGLPGKLKHFNALRQEILVGSIETRNPGWFYRDWMALLRLEILDGSDID